MIIKNRVEVDLTPLRHSALDIIEAGVEGVLPSVIFPKRVTYDLKNQKLMVNGQIHSLGKRVFVVGTGKASGSMAEIVENLIPRDKIIDGLVTCKGGTYNTRRIKVVIAGHPIPDERGVKAVNQLLALKDHYLIGASDTVIGLFSGGGSALFPGLSKGISLENKQVVTELLIASGADINEINIVRKHLSSVKGGCLGAHFAPAMVISLIISDVVGDDLSVIASGLTYPDSTTFQNALSILTKYELVDKSPASVITRFLKGTTGSIEDNPKHLDNCYNYVIANNRIALEAMRATAIQLGFKPHIITSEQMGDTETLAKQRADEIISGKYAKYDAIIIGGETTPTLPDNHGQGGRNQHYTAASVLEMVKYDGDWVLASLGTDGSDYMSDVAGAIADKSSFPVSISGQLDFEEQVKRYNSYNLFRKLGGSLISTGETGTNVGDIAVYLIKGRND